MNSVHEISGEPLTLEISNALEAIEGLTREDCARIVEVVNETRCAPLNRLADLSRARTQNEMYLDRSKYRSIDGRVRHADRNSHASDRQSGGERTHGREAGGEVMGMFVYDEDKRRYPNSAPVQIKDDSMSPTLLAGDWMLIDFDDRRPNLNEIVAVRSKSTLRVVVGRWRGASLTKDNPAFERVSIGPRDELLGVGVVFQRPKVRKPRGWRNGQ